MTDRFLAVHRSVKHTHTHTLSRNPDYVSVIRPVSLSSSLLGAGPAGFNCLIAEQVWASPHFC